MIPYGMSYTSTIHGQAPKVVKCEECGQQYIYLVKRLGTCEEISFLFLDNEGTKALAEERAHERMQDALERACEPIPCPKCGHVQKHMIRRARQLHVRWMGEYSLYLFLGTIFLGVPATIASAAYDPENILTLLAAIFFWLLVAGSAITSVVLFYKRMYWIRNFDPNLEDVDVRIERGRANSLTIEEFQLLAEEEKFKKRKQQRRSE